ncbi:MAG: DUF6531 domain-containing protein [Verrucomicrobia bacterium]|nr:DUF6531 domain-containing protein [Verrucomicrobiota bacterium]
MTSRSFKSSFVYIFFCNLLPLFFLTALNAQTYRATLLTHPDGFFLAVALNNNDQIAGTLSKPDGSFHALLREENGRFIELPELGGNRSAAFGMNDLGHVVGFTVDANGLNHSGVWNGGFTELGVPTGGSGVPTLVDINNQGVATGFYFDGNGFVHAAVWDANGMVQTLPELPGDESYANAINEDGQIVGASAVDGTSFHATLWQPNGGMTQFSPLNKNQSAAYQIIDLGTLGGPVSEALDINNSGQVVGDADADGQIFHAFFWEDGQMTDLDPNYPFNSIALGINDHGVVVGSLQLAAGSNSQRRDSKAIRRPYAVNALLSDPLIKLSFGLGGGFTFRIGIDDQMKAIDDWTPEGTPSVFSALYIIDEGNILAETGPNIDDEKVSLTKDPSRDETFANTSSQSENTAEPVNLFTGELFSSEPVDLFLGGPMPLFFQRYYASMLIQDGNIQSALSNNWLHNFDWQLTRFGENFIEVLTNRGRLILFEKVDNTWELRGRQDIPFQLVESGAEFILGDPRSNRLFTFDSSGKLIKIEDGKGNVHTLTYNGDQLTQVLDGLGRTLTFSYDGNDHLMSVSDGTRSILFDYSGDNLISFSDAEGNATTYSYDDAHPIPGLLTAKTLPEGNVPFSQTYDDNGRVIRQTDAQNNTFTFAYNEMASGASTKGSAIAFSQNMIETIMTDPLGNTELFIHNEKAENLSFTDQVGQVITLGYDNSGRRNSLTDRLGAITTYDFHGPSGRSAAINNADGTTMNFGYLARTVKGIQLYDLTSVTLADGTSEVYGYDAAGNLTSVTDRAGHITTYTYNNSGQVLTASNPEGGVTTITHNNDGNVASLEDPSGNKTTFSYDGLGRRTGITYLDGSQESFTYDMRDLVTSRTDERGNTTAFGYDANGNLTSRADPLGHTTTYAYDGMERLISETDPLGHSATRTYDELGRLQSWTNRNNNTFALNYDVRSRLTSMVDPKGNAWQRAFDDEGIVVSVTDPLGATRTFITDALGRIKGSTSMLGNGVNLTRDAVTRITSVQDPAGNTTGITYEARGLPSSITLPDGSTTTYMHNGLGQITRATDTNGHVWQRQYDSHGRLTSLTDPLENSAILTYDDRNRVSRVTLPGGLGTVDVGYDAAGNTISLQYSDGSSFNFTYDPLNRVTTADNVSFTYDPNGRITESNGLSCIRDADGRIISMTLESGKAVTYAYDGGNLVTEITDWLGGEITLSYDAAGRFQSIARPNGVTTAFTYDTENGITSITEGELSSITLNRDQRGFTTTAERDLPLQPVLVQSVTGFEYDAASQIEGYSYDALGRRTKDDARDYTWDLASRLTRYTEDGITVDFTYDGFGRRLSRIESGTTHEYVWNDALSLPSISVLRQNGVDVRYFIHTPDGILLYSIEASDDSRRFYHFDEMGNTLFLTDDNGEVIASYAYSPFGLLVAEESSVENIFTWQGALGVIREGDSDLYELRARYYDGVDGSFISRDPVAGLTANNINPYRYAFGNPLQFVDPTGLEGSYVRETENRIGRRMRDEREKTRKWLEDVNSPDYWDRQREEAKSLREAARRARKQRERRPDSAGESKGVAPEPSSPPRGPGGHVGLTLDGCPVCNPSPPPPAPVDGRGTGPSVVPSGGAADGGATQPPPPPQAPGKPPNITPPKGTQAPPVNPPVPPRRKRGTGQYLPDAIRDFWEYFTVFDDYRY